MLKLKLTEVMARHDVGRDALAEALGVYGSTVTSWRKGTKKPTLGTIDAIALAITKLSKRGETVTGMDLLEEIE